MIQSRATKIIAFPKKSLYFASLTGGNYNLWRKWSVDVNIISGDAQCHRRHRRQYCCYNGTSGSNKTNSAISHMDLTCRHRQLHAWQQQHFSSFATATDCTTSFSESCPYHIQVANNGKTIQITFPTEDASDGDETMNNENENKSTSIFHAAWLWSNDPSNVHPTSGQRYRSPGSYDKSFVIMSASVVDASEVVVDTNVSSSSYHSSPVVPIPPPPPGCCHSIGTVYSTKESKTIISSNNQKMLRIVWRSSHDNEEQSNGTPSPPRVTYYNMKWLESWRYDKHALEQRRLKTEVTPLDAIRAIHRYGNNNNNNSNSNHDMQRIKERNDDDDDNNRKSSDGLVHVNYDDVVEGNNTNELLRLFQAIFSDGAAIVKNTPQPTISTASENSNDNFPVARIGKTLGGGSLSHGALYGDVFHVQSIPNAHNVAYTSLPLAPHQDLAYYESMPGLQLLHCVEMGRNVVGGESVLVDAMAAAYRFRQLSPKYFRTLVDCPTMFVKQRDGACMTYLRPCIVLASNGGEVNGGDKEDDDDYINREIVGVNWSPPFEGPLCIHPDQVENYYEAYAAFERMIDTSVSATTTTYADGEDSHIDNFSQYALDYTWERQLEPGEILVFNNRRLLHGRRGFRIKKSTDTNDYDKTGGSYHQREANRHLIGAYTDIDNTLNTYRTLLGEEEPRVDHFIRNAGNGTSIVP